MASNAGRSHVMDGMTPDSMIPDLKNMMPAGPDTSNRPDSEALLSRVFARIEGEPARVTTDLEGHITSINPAFSSLCGFSFGEIEGKKPGQFLQGTETDPGAVDTIRQAVRARASCTTELVNYHKNGGRYRVRIEVEPLRDGMGNVVGFSAAERKID